LSKSRCVDIGEADAAARDRVRAHGEAFVAESMRARLDAVASQSGMGKVFRLRGLDVCRVVSIEAVPVEPDRPAPARETRGTPHERLRAFTDEVHAAADVEDLITRSLGVLDRSLGYRHAMLLLVDASGERLYTVASRGYPTSSAGSEVRIGEGHIGVAAERRRSVLVANMAKDQAYTDAVRRSAARSGRQQDLERAIALPGLPIVMSQLVVPVVAPGRLLGVLCLQSDTPGRFLSDDEHLVSIAAAQIGLAMALLELAPTIDSSGWHVAVPPADVPPAEVTHYASDDRVLVDNEYLIKGVAGRILWRLLHQNAARHRVDFSNKEIRLDQSLALPDLKDNLEARLILLRGRLRLRRRVVEEVHDAGLERVLCADDQQAVVASQRFQQFGAVPQLVGRSPHVGANRVAHQHVGVLVTPASQQPLQGRPDTVHDGAQVLRLGCRAAPQFVECRRHGAAPRVAHDDDEPGAERRRCELDAAYERRRHDVAGHADHEQVAEALVEHQLGGYARVRTAQKNRERSLAGDQVGAAGGVGRRGPGGPAGDEPAVAVAKAGQSFGRGQHGKTGRPSVEQHT
jgi:GAF domain